MWVSITEAQKWNLMMENMGIKTLPSMRYKSILANCLGYTELDTINYLVKELELLDESIMTMQSSYLNRHVEERNEADYGIQDSEIERSGEHFLQHTNNTMTTPSSRPPLHSKKRQTPFSSRKNFRKKLSTQKLFRVDKIAKEGMNTAELATKGAIRGVFEAARALELLTIGTLSKFSSTAFVTFKNRLPSCVSVNMLLSHHYYSMEISPAPSPKDIIWENVALPLRQVRIRQNISSITLTFGGIFWSIVVAFITAISNLEFICRQFPELKAYEHTKLYTILDQNLAILILLVFLTLLPYLFDFLSRSYEGVKLESEIQHSVMTRYFYYQLANVFVAVGLGSMASSIHNILRDPSSILVIFGSSIPSLWSYFANLVIIKTFIALPLEMLRPYQVLVYLKNFIFLDSKEFNEKKKSPLFVEQPLLYGSVYPNLLMVFMIMINYSCIAPLVMPFCLLYFGFAYLMYKYQLLYVYVNWYQSGGYMWYALFNMSIIVLLCGVLTLLCYLLIKEGKDTAYSLLPLPLFICLFWYHCQSRFMKISKSLSLETAIEMDKAVSVLKRQSKPVPQTHFRRTLYRQPALIVDRGQEKLLNKLKQYEFSSSKELKSSATLDPNRLSSESTSSSILSTSSNDQNEDEDLLQQRTTDSRLNHRETEKNLDMVPTLIDDVEAARPTYSDIDPNQTDTSDFSIASTRNFDTSVTSSISKNEMQPLLSSDNNEKEEQREQELVRQSTYGAMRAFKF